MFTLWFVVEILLFLTQSSEIDWQYVYYKQYNVLGMGNAEETGDESIVYSHRKTFRKQFIRNGNNWESIPTTTFLMILDDFLI